MAESKTYRARERGYCDDRMIEEGETFTTAAPKGKWMALLDKDGNELPDPEPERKPDPLQAQIDELKAKHATDLADANGRADAAEKSLADATAQIDELKAKLAAFDGDGDGQPGGSRAKK